MWEKEKISKSFSTGVIILIFLLLFIQFVFFVIKAVDSYGSDDGVAEAVAVVSKDTVSMVKEGVVQRGGDTLVRGKLKVKKTVVSNSRSSAYSGKTEKKTLPSERKFHNYPIEINRADTSDFNSLYGIGAYYAMKIVEYRERLGGSFVAPEQLMEVWGIDSARFYGFSERLFVDSSSVIRLDLYGLEVDSLARHPYIGSYAAKGIERYRKMVDREDFSVDKLVEYNIIGADEGEMLKLYCR